MNLVIVESPAKAKTINKYLGSSYRVLASYGHIRDLPSKEGSVSPDDDFSMAWAVNEVAEKRVKDIVSALKKAKTLILATDPDREGEAISWHICEELTRRKVLAGKTIQRVVFNEVTKKAIVEAFGKPRELNMELVEAYLARRALDYLFGFTLSPVLWRKLPGSKSAGRVQSVALRMICVRESEIEKFESQEYWSVTAQLQTQESLSFSSRLVGLSEQTLDKFDLPDAQTAERAADLLKNASSFTVASVERKKSKRNPSAPFTTSTLQQDSSRKLGLGAAQTMRLAQSLYEGVDIGGESVGLITYMRTDGVSLSGEAIAASRDLIAKIYGPKYVPAHPRLYKSKAKNAQEAHEAIRPTDMNRLPRDLKALLDPQSYRLYELIWNRTMASQMEAVVFDQVVVDVSVNQGDATLRANGSIVAFDGFTTLYKDRRNDGAEQDKRLPRMSEGDVLQRESVEAEQHFTQPPARFSEASLVKNLEELGIGRPSTYASIIQVLQDRNYVRLEAKRFFPEDRGRIVTTFLENFFKRYVEYNFTADLENSLDDISAGTVNWKSVLRDFWVAFDEKVSGTKDLTITEVIETLDEELGLHFFPTESGNALNPRQCPTCDTGRLGIKLGRMGGFIGCSGYPDCRYTRALGIVGEGGEDADLNQPKDLCKDQETGLMISLRKGPYGFYLQLGEGIDGQKPKRVSVPKTLSPDDLSPEIAQGLMALPRDIGPHPDDGVMITAGIGRYGPFVKHGNSYKSLEKDDDILFIGLNRAVALIAQAPKRGAAALRSLGPHPDDGNGINIYSGRYGPYAKWNKLNASLPKGTEVDSITLEDAVALLARQAEKKGVKKKTPTRKATKKKIPAKKKT